MDITPNTRTVTEYQLTLSSEEARQCLDQPWEFGEALADKLVAAGLDRKPAANGNGKHPNRVHLTLGNGKGPGKKAGKRAAKKAGPKAEKPLHPCPHCARTFKHQGRLNNHLASEHASTPAPAAAAE